MKIRTGINIRRFLTTAGFPYVCASLLLLAVTPHSFASSTLTFSPSEAAFGTVVIGETKTVNVQLTNRSGGEIAITSISIEGFSSFSATDKCPAQLAAGATCTVQVSFHPVSGAGYHGNQSAVIVFYDGTFVVGAPDANGTPFRTSTTDQQ